MKAVIRTEGLTKYYGKMMGIEDVSLEVPGGVVFGFLGPNGAGKTTTMRILMDLLRPSEGRAEVVGLDTRENSIEIRGRVGYLPGELALYDRLTAQEMFRFFADLRAVGDLGWAPEWAPGTSAGRRSCGRWWTRRANWRTLGYERSVATRCRNPGFAPGQNGHRPEPDRCPGL